MGDAGTDAGTTARAGVRAALVVLAGGSGTRAGGVLNKVLAPVAGRPVLAWSLRRVADAPWCVRTVVVGRADELDAVRAVVASCPGPRPVDVVAGGGTRHGSERNALRVLEADVAAGALDVVVVHDAARPLAPRRLFDDVVATAARSGAALPVVPRRDVLLAGAVADVAAVQTPQAFAAAPLVAAYRRADADGFTGTDTAACVERYTDLVVVGVPGSPRNLKVTFAPDLPLASALLAAEAADEAAGRAGGQAATGTTDEAAGRV
ncbi:IspD/TarI family cytidylyltransferase [Aquipuribacter sp. SD81]|uniref:IspD/TarI family cytidylyltransferase n=1 Tax=Aquipuribacter sp. SD81 TaxID=3127703 RepID=UPI003016E869